MKYMSFCRRDPEPVLPGSRLMYTCLTSAAASGCAVTNRNIDTSLVIGLPLDPDLCVQLVGDNLAEVAVQE
ncbi:hypothetical protein RB213_014577 [Colletotrichum asianum]